jgi:hypothetical protein
MIDDRELFERASLRFYPPQGELERLLRRRDRRRRNRRIASAIAALLIATAAIGSLIKIFGSGERQPASGPITPSNVSDLRLLGSLSLSGLGFAASDGLAYVAHDQTHELEAYPMSCYAITASCKPAWVAHIDGARMVGIEAGGGNVYVSTDVVSAFSASCGTGGATCRPIWVGTVPRLKCGGCGSIELGRGLVYASGNRRLYAFPTSCTGRCAPAWVSSALPAGTTGYIYPVVTPDTVFLTGEGMDSLFMAFPAHCATDGSVCRPSGIWNVPGGQYPSPPIIADGEIFISNGGQLLVYPESCAVGLDCLPLWTSPVGGSIVADEGKVFAALTDGTVQAIPTRCDAPPCQPAWEAPGTPSGGMSGMNAANGLLYVNNAGPPRVGSPRGGIYAFPIACGSGDAACKPVWTWGTAEHLRIGGLIVTDTRLYAIESAFGGDYLYVFGVKSGAGTAVGTGAGGATQTGTLVFYVGVAALAVLLALVVVTRRRRMSNGVSS